MDKISKSYRTNKHTILCYILLFCIIQVSGNPLFHVIRFRESVVVVFLATVVCSLFLIKKIVLKSGSLFCISYLCVSVLLTYITNGASSFQTYIAIILQLMAGFLFSYIFDKDVIEMAYVNIMSVLMLISLIMYFLQLAIPSIWLLFPREQGTYFTYANVGYVFNYLTLPNVGNYVLPRNSGMFWEPGCYQFFLNFSLVLLISSGKNKNGIISRKDFLLVLLYAITIITTKSTTGLFLLVLIIALNFGYVVSIFFDNKKSFFNIFIGVGALVTCVWIFIKQDFVGEIVLSFSKINSSTYMDNNGLVERLSLSSIKLLCENIYRIFGLSFESLYSMPDYHVWNSIIEDALALGIPFVIIVLSGIYKFAKKHDKLSALLIFVICIISLSAESLFHTMFMFVIMSIGFGSNIRGWSREYENSNMLQSRN